MIRTRSQAVPLWCYFRKERLRKCLSHNQNTDARSLTYHRKRLSLCLDSRVPPRLFVWWSKRSSSYQSCPWIQKRGDSRWISQPTKASKVSPPGSHAFLFRCGSMRKWLEANAHRHIHSDPPAYCPPCLPFKYCSSSFHVQNLAFLRARHTRWLAYSTKREREPPFGSISCFGRFWTLGHWAVRAIRLLVIKAPTFPSP